MSGVEEKSAVCITLFSEALISLSGGFTYLWAGSGVDWGLTFCLLVSVSLSAPVAALIIKRMEGGKLRVLVGVATTLLCLGTVLKVFFW